VDVLSEFYVELSSGVAVVGGFSNCASISTDVADITVEVDSGQVDVCWEGVDDTSVVTAVGGFKEGTLLSDSEAIGGGCEVYLVKVACGT